jgi:hypothetical protein
MTRPLVNQPWQHLGRWRRDSDTRRRALIALIAAAALTAPVASSGATKPALRVVHDLPLTLRGSGFRRGEPVRITVRMGERRLRASVRTGSAGVFTVRFAGVRLDYCSTPLTIVARATRSGVVAANIPIRECAAP